MTDISTYPALTFSHEELALLLKIFNVKMIPGTGETPLAGLTEDEQALILSSAERSLQARGLMKIKGEQDIILDPLVIGLIGPCLRPEQSILFWRVSRENGFQSRFFHKTFSLLVEHFLPEKGLHTFAALPNNEALQERIKAFLATEDIQQDSTVTEIVELPRQEFDRMITLQLGQGDIDLEDVSNAPVQDQEGEWVTNAPDNFIEMTTILLSKTEPTSKAHGLVILKGDNGTWQVEKDNGLVRLSKISFLDIWSQIQHFFFPYDKHKHQE